MSAGPPEVQRPGVTVGRSSAAGAGSGKDSYRPDIDGLRALAVVPVILFHAGFWCPGGYIGVDVFFVISGYLITQIIERDLAAHRFSVLVFYQRRIRRIFPALFAMLTAVLVFGYVVLPPRELEALGQTSVAAAAFSSNILFFRWAGYFAPSSEATPLLHTWTLSLEEQFYVCWPLLLLLLSRKWAVRWKIPATAIVLVATLLLSSLWVRRFPNGAFYLLPSRAWELALGAMLSFSSVGNLTRRLPRAWAAAVSLAGIAMLGLAVGLYDRSTAFPGVAALLPCAGAGLVIAAGEAGPSLGGRLLSLAPVAAIGKISYSLYLWHWPVFVLGQLLANRRLLATERMLLILLILAVSWFSYRWIETPFRQLKVVRSKVRRWVVGGLLTSGLFIAAGLYLFVRDGLPERGPGLGELDRQERALQTSPCLARGAAVPPAQGCLLGAEAGKSRYKAVLWGDSHAAQLAPAFEEIGRRLSLTTREITKAGCPPLPGVRFLPPSEDRVDCPAFNRAAMDAILADPGVLAVVLASRWDAVVEGSLLLTSEEKGAPVSDSRQHFVRSLRQVLTVLVESGRRVVVVGQVPPPPAGLVPCVGRARFRGLDESRCAQDLVTVHARTESLVRQWLGEGSLQLEAGVKAVHPYDLLCNQQRCRVDVDGRLLYLDESHLSTEGARLLIPSLEAAVASALGYPLARPAAVDLAGLP